jgi:hypothetical protein
VNGVQRKESVTDDESESVYKSSQPLLPLLFLS